MKKYFKIVWKSLLAVAAVSVVFIGVMMGCAWYNNYNSYYDKRWLSEDVVVKYCYNKDTHKVYNTKLKKVTMQNLDNVVAASEGDSLTVFFKDGLRGFLNTKTGYEVIPAQYKKAWVFSEGLAAVMDHSGKIGFINKDNEVVLPFVYNYRRNWPIDYYFNNGYCVMTDERGACGMIDKNGNWVMEPQYDSIWKLYFGKYRMVKEGDKYGMIDENLNFIFPIEYDRIEYPEQEHDGVLLTKGCVKQHASLDGTIINPFVIDYVENLYFTQRMATKVVCDEENDYISTVSEEEILADYVRYSVNSKYGLMHRETGNIILPAIYENIYMISSKLIGAQLSGTYDYVVFDTQGRRVH